MTLTITMRSTLHHLKWKTFPAVMAEMSESLRKHGTQRLPHRSVTSARAVHVLMADAYREREQRNARAGVSSWEDILLEEVYEALAEDDLTARRAELVQVMNVCALEIEQIDCELSDAQENDDQLD